MKDVEISNVENAYKGFFRIRKYTFHHTLYQGGVSKSLTREVFERGNSAAVLLYDPAWDIIALVEQFRIGAYVNGNKSPWTKELIAGMIENCDTPENTVIRETKEEAGISITEIRKLGTVLLSPGGSSESCDVFVAFADLSNVGGYFGNKHEGEDIKVTVYPYKDVVNMVNSGEICSATAVIAIQWLSLYKIKKVY